MRHIVAMLAALALAATVAACGGDAADEAGAAAPIRIGLIVSLTGDHAPLGSEGKRAVELAVDQLNANGGVLGRKVEILFRDDKTLSEQAVRAFDDLSTKGVAAIIGPVFPDAALALAPLTQREGIPQLSLSPTSEQVQPIRPYVFVTPALAPAYAERFLQYLKAEHITRIAMAYDAKSAYSVAGHESINELGADYGVQVVTDETYETATTDFGPILAHVRDSGAGAFLFWGTGAPGVTVTKQYAASGLKVPLMLTAAQASSLWLDPVGAAAEGVTVQSAIGVVGDHLPPGPQKKIIDQLAGPYRQKHGYPPSQFAQNGYSAALLLFEAIRRAGGADRGRVRQALESTTLLTPTGRFRYSPTDHSGLSPDYISVNTVRDGRFVPTGWAGEQLARTVAAN